MGYYDYKSVLSVWMHDRAAGPDMTNITLFRGIVQCIPFIVALTTNPGSRGIQGEGWSGQ